MSQEKSEERGFAAMDPRGGAPDGVGAPASVVASREKGGEASGEKRKEDDR
jgi:hypothetical protein